MKNIFWIYAFVVLFAAPIQARTFLGEGAFKKSQDKESTRWTLAGWLTQKQQFGAMDQWLVLNKSANLFEVNIGGGHRTYDVTTGGVTTKEELTHGSISVFWSIFGLEYQFEDSSEKFKRESGQFNLRLLGTSSQTTSLTAFYGVSKTTYDLDSTQDIQNNYAGARLNLYLVSFFGVEGVYRVDFSDKNKAGAEIEKTRLEYGAFFDLNYVRIYGQAFQETTDVSPAGGGTTTSTEREGVEGGVRFYL